MARQVQSGLLQAALRAMRASRGTSSRGRKLTAAARPGGRGRVIAKLVCASAIGIAGPVQIDSRRGESDEQ